MAATVAPSPNMTMTYGQSFKTWISFKLSKSAQDIETKILSIVPFYPVADATRRAEIINTPINGGKNYIHEFYIENTEKPTSVTDNKIKDVVLIHGYGAALGFFYKNFSALSSIPGIRIHAIDMLGFGLSSRPRFPHYGTDTIEEVTKTEDFFIDSIEEWRKERGLDNFVLIGHSLGGYISCCYTMKYNKNNLIDKLILVSPVGVERNVHSMYKYDNLSNEDIDLKDNVPENPSRNMKFFKFLWDHNISLFSVLRSTGPFSSKLISNWSYRRFKQLPPDELSAMHDYVYQIFNDRGSGEHCITRLLAPFAVARLPLMDRAPERLTQLNVDSLWMYGDNDWMDQEAGEQMTQEIKKAGGKATYSIIKNAGHHLYLDNPEHFHSEVFKFLGYA